MRVLALLLPDLLARCRAALEHRNSVVAVTGHLACAAITSEAWDVFVLDPRIGRDDLFDSVLKAVEASFIPLCLYASPMNPVIARRITAAAARGCTCIVIQDFDDSPPGFRRCLERARETQTRVCLLDAVGAEIARMPERLQAGLVSALCGPLVPTTVNALAKEIRASRHTLDRWTRQAGFRGPKLLLDCIRLARYRDFAPSDLGHQAILERSGFTTERKARERCRLLLRAPLRFAARAMSTAEFASRLVAVIRIPSIA